MDKNNRNNVSEKNTKINQKTASKEKGNSLKNEGNPAEITIKPITNIIDNGSYTEIAQFQYDLSWKNVMTKFISSINNDLNVKVEYKVELEYDEVFNPKEKNAVGKKRIELRNESVAGNYFISSRIFKLTYDNLTWNKLSPKEKQLAIVLDNKIPYNIKLILSAKTIDLEKKELIESRSSVTFEGNQVIENYSGYNHSHTFEFDKKDNNLDDYDKVIVTLTDGKSFVRNINKGSYAYVRENGLNLRFYFWSYSNAIDIDNIDYYNDIKITKIELVKSNSDSNKKHMLGSMDLRIQNFSALSSNKTILIDNEWKPKSIKDTYTINNPDVYSYYLLRMYKKSDKLNKKIAEINLYQDPFSNGSDMYGMTESFGFSLGVLYNSVDNKINIKLLGDDTSNIEKKALEYSYQIIGFRK